MAAATGRTGQDTQTATSDTARTAIATSGTAGKDPARKEHRHAPQPFDSDPNDDLEQLGRPIYQGDGLEVRGLSEEEIARFLAAHAGQPARLLGSGWANLEPHTADEHVEPERRLTFNCTSLAPQDCENFLYDLQPAFGRKAGPASARRPQAHPPPGAPSHTR